jgi:hypothetical protein
MFDVIQLEETLSNAGFVNIEVVNEEEEFRSKLWSAGRSPIPPRRAPTPVGSWRSHKESPESLSMETDTPREQLSLLLKEEVGSKVEVS